MQAVQVNGAASTTMPRAALLIFVFVGAVLFLLPEVTFSQGETTSAIIGEVSDASGAARDNAVVGFEKEEPREETIDVRRRGEFGQLAGKVTGEFVGIALFLAELGVAETEMRFRNQDAKGAAAARDGTVTTEG